MKRDNDANLYTPFSTSVLRLTADLNQIGGEFFLDIGKTVTSLHAIFGRKWRELQTTVKARVRKRFQSSLHQMKDNDRGNKMAISVVQNFAFFKKYF